MDFPTIKYLTKEIFGQIKENKFLKIINGDVKLYDNNNKFYTKSADKLRREHFY